MWAVVQIFFVPSEKEKRWCSSSNKNQYQSLLFLICSLIHVGLQDTLWCMINVCGSCWKQENAESLMVRLQHSWISAAGSARLLRLLWVRERGLESSLHTIVCHMIIVGLRVVKARSVLARLNIVYIHASKLVQRAIQHLRNRRAPPCLKYFLGLFL